MSLKCLDDDGKSSSLCYIAFAECSERRFYRRCLVRLCTELCLYSVSETVVGGKHQKRLGGAVIQVHLLTLTPSMNAMARTVTDGCESC